MKKLLSRLSDLLPGKRVYFIYTYHHFQQRFKNGLKANTELSYWNFEALKKAFPRVTFLKLQGERPSKIKRIKSQDVVIGHIGETFEKASELTEKMIAFNPWSGNEDRNHARKFNCISKSLELSYYDKSKCVILLTSEFNYRKYLLNAENRWYQYFKNKPFRLVHQAMDFSLYPRIKTEYRTSNFLYVGNDAHMKCLDAARSLVTGCGRSFSIYGVGGKRLDSLDSLAVKRLADEADFFIQPGRWEAQSVSILEAAARGFIPIVSRETGYPYEHPYLLRYGDLKYNGLILEKLLKTSAEERKELADDLHQQLMEDPKHNDWKTLTDVLVEEVQKLYI